MPCRRKIAFELGKSANMKHLAKPESESESEPVPVPGAGAGTGAEAVALPAVCGNQTMPLG